MLFLFYLFIFYFIYLFIYLFILLLQATLMMKSGDREFVS